MPEWFFILVVFCFGAVMGSFLKVVSDRLHTGKSMNDRSRCFSCGVTLSWRNLFPIFSFLLQKGRCARCQAKIPLGNLLVELLTACGFLLVFFTGESLFEVVLGLVLISCLIVVVVYDMRHFIIPDEFSAMIALCGLSLLAYQAFAFGDAKVFLLGLLTGFAAFFFFAFFWWYSDGRWMGFGDAKLAFGLSLPLGVMGGFSLIVLSFWVGALIVMSGLILKAVYLHIKGRRGASLRAKMKSEVPFGPFLAAAFSLVYFFNVNVLTLLSTFFPGI